MNRDELRTALADLAHEVWAGWWRHQNTVSVTIAGEVIIPADKVSRWDRQSKTPHAALSPKEQASDLGIADRYLALVDAYVGSGGEE